MDLLDITIIIIVLTFSTATVTGNSTILTINGFYQIWKLHLFRVQSTITEEELCTLQSK